tara:strand:- start:592 stop:1590 length:999 start_codon:yes stop_codon:yes gene_type:complete
MMDILLLLSTTLAASPPLPSLLHWVHGVNLSVAIDAHSGILTHINASSGWQRDCVGQSVVSDGTSDIVSVVVTPNPLDGSLTVTRAITTQGYGTQPLQTFNATLTDRFSTCGDPNVGGVQWTLTVSTPSSSPWRAAVTTDLAFNVAAAQYWVPLNGKGMKDDVLQMKNASETTAAVLGQDQTYISGARELMPYPVFLLADDVSGGGGLIITPRLNDSTLGATATINSSRVIYTRLFNKLSAASGTNAVSFTMHLTSLDLPDPAAISPALPINVRQDDPWRAALKVAMEGECGMRPRRVKIRVNEPPLTPSFYRSLFLSRFSLSLSSLSQTHK